MAKDPVCGMTIDEKTAAGTSQYKGQTIYFCATICKTKFDQDPARYMERK
jgi:Cu+-exporting ATPase